MQNSQQHNIEKNIQQKQHSQPEQNKQEHSPSMKKIMNKFEHINYLILHKGYLKVKVTSHFVMPSNKNNKQLKVRVILVPSSYTVFKLKQEIKKTFEINQKQAIFLFVKTQKIVDSNMTIKEMFGKFVGTQNLITSCLELSAYSSQFS